MFAAAATPDSFELRAEAALRSIPSAALALVSAAATHGWGPPADQIDLAVPPGGRNRLEGTRIVQTPLPAGHVVRRNGWRVTSVERTLVDLGRVLSVVELQRCIADRVIERRTTMARVEAMFAELATRGRPGIARVRRALSALDDHPPAESELEATSSWTVGGSTSGSRISSGIAAATSWHSLTAFARCGSRTAS